MSRNHNNIPLLCSICPKNPQFSDVSHLLTHTSSKAHLSNYFKLKIRAASELGAKVQLDNFEDWYDNYDLERLLSERLASKDQKKAAKDKNLKTKARALPLKIKKENEQVREDESNLAPMFRAPIPRMHLWPTTTNSNSNSHTNTNTSTPDMGSEWDQSAVYTTPTTRRQVPGYSLHATPSADGASIAARNTTPLKIEGADSEVVEERLSDSTKLKGVLWPGMDLFDSATAEMKRMRNQRKDGSILESMMAASAEVEPMEISYHADGAFRTARDIFGPLSTETSPVRDPTPKKRRSRKMVLADLSTNVPRLRAPRQRGVVMASPQKRKAPVKERHLVGQLDLHSQPALNPLAFSSRFAPSNEEDEEFRMTVGDMGTKKRPFGVFQDEPEVSPGRTESPLEDHRFDFSDNASNAFVNANLDSISPTPVIKPTAIRMFGKENSSHNNNDSGVSMRQTQAAPTSHHGFPQMFYDNVSMYNPLYNHQPRSFYSGEPTDLSHLGQEHKPMTGFTPNFHNNFIPAPRLGSNHLQNSNTINARSSVNMSHFGM